MKTFSKKEEKMIFNVAMADIIDDIMEKRKIIDIVELDGYESDEDRIQIRYGFLKMKKAYLLGVYRPSFNKDLKVFVASSDKLTTKDLTLKLEKVSCDFMESVACEVYDYLRDENDPEFEDYCKEKVGNFFDTFCQ